MESSSKFSLSSPSNIAFIKYWGKYGRQLPMNASISMTLKECRTIFDVEYRLDGAGIELYFDGEKNEKFENRFKKILVSIEDVYPLAEKLYLKINSRNTFPHSAGIASSASAMSALAMSLLKIEESQDLQRASLMARLASGSASRSVYPNYSVWGNHTLIENSTNEYAVEFSDFHPDFSQMCDSIIIVDENEKSVSSSAGHSLMNSHPYREGRIDQANENFRVLVNAMKSGEFADFGNILENEALSLHALMMSSDPSYLLLRPKSIQVIEELRINRGELPIYFTIDAGPNIHVIYPKSIETKAKDIISSIISELSLTVIHDEIGQGPNFV